MNITIQAMPKAPKHLIDQAQRSADFVHQQFNVTKIVVHEDHVAYHDMLPIPVLDAIFAKYDRINGKDVEIGVVKPLSWDQIPKANVSKKRKKI